MVYHSKKYTKLITSRTRFYTVYDDLARICSTEIEFFNSG